MSDDSRQDDRHRMVETQIRARGIASDSVLRAMAGVPRHLFVPDGLRAHAYDDRLLPIGTRRTICPPYIAAAMAASLDVRPDDVVLEVGTGSGYQTAILAMLAREVISIEIVPELADRARCALERIGVRNARILTGDGCQGCPDQAPFARIIVTAAPVQLPQPLLDQLAIGGTMVVPLNGGSQEMMIVTRSTFGVSGRRTLPVRW